MGALTSNRKRTDECWKLHGPYPSFNNTQNYCDYSHSIDARVLKKPKIASVIQSPEKVNSNLPPQNTVSRLNRYPEPTRQLRREVHAPCRVHRFGFLSSLSSSGFRSKATGSSEKAERMGNALRLDLLRVKYEQAKERAFSVLHHVSEPERKNEDVGLDDWSDVEIIEDVNGVRPAAYDAQRAQEPDGLALLLDSQKSVGKTLENGHILASSSVLSDLTKVGCTEKLLDSLSLDRKAYDESVYKRLLENVERSHSNKLRSLKFEIDSEEAKWHSIRSLRTLKKPEEAKKPVEDSYHKPFVPLTVEEEKEVGRAFSNSNRRKILVTHENSNIQITGELLQCLRPGAWLNDEVINVYLELLKERERREPKKFLNCHFFNTFFYKKLIGGGNGYDYKSVRRWTTQRKLGYGLVECDKIFVPIHKEVHWCLAVINKKEKKFQYLDSLGGIDLRVMNVLARYFVDEVKDKSGQNIDVSLWEREYVEDLPAQQNGFDCGVFMIKYADFYSRGMELQFSQENMPYFRLRTAKEILRLRAD